MGYWAIAPTVMGRTLLPASLTRSPRIVLATSIPGHAAPALARIIEARATGEASA